MAVRNKKRKISCHSAHWSWAEKAVRSCNHTVVLCGWPSLRITCHLVLIPVCLFLPFSVSALPLPPDVTVSSGYVD